MIQNILTEMIKYDAGDVLRIQHFVKVYSFAHMIGELEEMSGEQSEPKNINWNRKLLCFMS